MFQRVTHEEWMQIIPMISFGIMFAVFVGATWMALRLKPKERERLAQLPLENSKPSND